MTTTTATVMFTDLVGSTELAVKLGETRYDEVRRAHDAILRAAVEGAGGVVVKGLGDGIMATFASVGDGVTAARAIQQAIHRHNQRGRNQPLSVRVGLTAGDVTVEGADCFGPTVVEASRLCAAANGDQILANDLVRALARGRPDDGFTVVGPMPLKGLPDPIPVVDVRWVPLQPPVIPLPARLNAVDPTFVGRATELAALDAAYDDVSESARRRVVLLGGEPGVGKTTVVARAAQGWHARGAAVAIGWCEQDLRAPYRAFVEALGHLVAFAPLDVLRGHVERHGASVLPLAPGLANRVPQLPDRLSTDPETERLLLFSAAADLFAALGEDQTLVVVFDDLHWADAGTASLLRSLATSAEPARLLIVGTFRDAELASEHPMGQALAAFRRVPSVARMQVGGLGSNDVVRLVERWTGTEVGEGGARLAADLVAETGGNAFFVTEVIRHLDETGELTSARGDTLLPDSVREVIGDRVARLGSEAEVVLGTAAVVGSEFDLALLSAVTGLDESKVLALLDDATRAALVREVGDMPGRFLFAHALVQHAVLANMGPTREVSLHRRVAEVLELTGREGAPVAELAHHWLQATRLSDSARARDWARHAGDTALAGLAPGDAVAYYRQALLLHDQIKDADPAMRIDLLIAVGTAERLSADPEYRETLLKAGRLARRGGDNARLAAAALANHRGTFSTFGGVDRERVAMLEAAIASQRPDTEQALLLATLANELTYSGDYPRRRTLTDAAMQAARTTGDDVLLLRVMNLVFYSVWVPDTLVERLALTEESRTLCTRVEDPLIRYWAHISNYLNVIQARRVGEADALLDETAAVADRLAQPALLWRVEHTRAARAILAGDTDEAERLATRARELGVLAAEAEADVYCKTQLMAVRWQRGTMAILSAKIDGTRPRPPNEVAALSLVFAEGDRQAEARAILERESAVGFTNLRRDPAYITGLAMFAEATALLRDVHAAGQLHQLLVPYADQVGFDGVMSVGALEHYLGALAALLGHHDEAVRRLERSCHFHQSVGASFFEARSRLELAAALHTRRRSGDEDLAAGNLRRAVDLAAAHGYRAVSGRAQDLLEHMTGA